MMNEGPGMSWDAVWGAVVAAIGAVVGWIVLIARIQQKLDDHTRRDDERFESIKEDMDERFKAMDERLNREHAENRETLHRIDSKLDRVIENQMPRARGH